MVRAGGTTGPVPPYSSRNLGRPVRGMLEFPGTHPTPEPMSMTLGQLQQRIRELYGDKDARRGVEGTFMWFMEEVGELSAALRGGSHDERVLEFADVLA